jgi:predicted permease
MTSLWRDLRIGVRVLLKRPGFTAIVVLALALGLGVNAVVFSLVNRHLVRPLPARDPGRLVAIQARGWSNPGQRSPVSYPDYREIRAESSLFEGVFAARFESYAFAAEPVAGEPPFPSETLLGEVVSGNYFDVLGVSPRLGRTFGAREGEDPAADPVVLISEGLWRTRFGGSPAVLGRKIHFNGHALTVIGVMPARWKGAVLWLNGASFWYPLAIRPRLEPGNDGWLLDRARREVNVFARLRPGVTLAQAQARMGVLGRTLARQFPATNADLDLRAVSEIEGRYGAEFATARLAGLLALLLAGLVLLICCANVANLLLARAAGRTKELGIRLALGAGRARVIRQLMTESLLLALAGGALGLVVAAWLPHLLLAFLPPVPFEVPMEVEVDPTVVAWTMLAAVVAGLIFGSLPAWRASQADLVTALKSDVGAEGQRLRRGGLRQGLVVAQIAISVVVVLTGGLIVRSLVNLQAIDPGYRADTLVSAQINPGYFQAYGASDDPSIGAYFQQLVRRLEQVPGVRSVSTVAPMPLVNPSQPVGPVVRPGEAQPPADTGLTTGYAIIQQKYFETTGTRLVRGRDFAPGERTGTPAAVIVNAELARRLFGGADQALGKSFRIGSPRAPWLRIVGVAQDGRYRALFEAPAPWVYLPGCAPELDCEDLTYRSVLVRADNELVLPAVAKALRQEAAHVDARVPLDFLLVGRGHLAPQLHPARLAAELGLVLSLLALALATLGIYSVMTYAVTQRTKEIGIRMALGGQVRDVLVLVMRQGLGLAVVGIAAGVLLALAAGRLLNDLLFRVGAADPLTLAVTIVVLALVALLATLLPARRAARVIPMVAIRHDHNR